MEVRKPQLIAALHTLDFGPGFYTTTNFEQASEFAKKVVDRNDGVGVATVTTYAFDEEVVNSVFEIRRFVAPSDDWLDFVVDNRRGLYAGPAYDLKIGPVANDNVYRTVQLFMTGVLSRDQTIAALKVRKLFNQYVFSTERALSMLRFVKSEVVQ